MVQVLPGRQKSPNFLQGLGSGLIQGGSDVLGKYVAEKKLKEEQAKQEMMRRRLMEDEDAAANRLGIDLAGISDPKVRQSLFVEAAKSKQQQDFLKSLGLGGGSAEQPRQQEERPSSGTNLNSSIFDSLDDQQRAQLSLKFPQLASLLERQKEFSQRQTIAQEDRDLKKLQHADKQVTESYKENQPYIDKVYDEYEVSQKRDAQLTRMQQLIDSGELTAPGLANVFHMFHIPIENLSNMTNDEFNKLSNDLTTGITSDYGSRVLASEFQTMLRRIPTLLNTDEGKRQIIQNMKILLEPARLKQEALRHLIDEAEVKNKPLPHNIRGVIQKEIQPHLDKIYEDFKLRNGRVKVEEGTPITSDVVQKYMELSRDKKTGAIDIDKAEEMAEKDGYDIGKQVQAVSPRVSKSGAEAGASFFPHARRLAEREQSVP